MKKKILIIGIIFIILIMCMCACQPDSDIPIEEEDSGINFSYDACTVNYQLISSLENVIVDNEEGLKNYFTNNPSLEAIDNSGNYTDTTLGNILKKYTESYFSSNIVCIIATGHTPDNHVYEITKVYLIEDKLYVIREDVPPNYTHVAIVGGYLYFIEIEKSEIKDVELSELKIGGYYKESQWESNNT